MDSSPRICSACQTSNPPQAAFCFGCGQPLEPDSPTSSKLLHQRYQLLHKLGTGGFGAVYQAEDIQLGQRLVAVKEMSAPGSLSTQEKSETTEAFKREALLPADLMHPNLPRIYDHFSEGGRWYLVMDYIKGETLETYLEKQSGGYLPVSEALDMGLQLCDVLNYLHTRQVPIIFRDLKPLNIMRTASGHLYLIDFGIARHFKPGQIKDTVAFGSPGYAAPEQYGKTQTTPRSDIYSLGATLHQMLTGIDPSLSPSGQTIRTYRKHTHQITSLDWSPDSQRIVSSSLDNSVQIWDIQTGQTYVNYIRHREIVYRAVWSPNGRYIASDSYDNTVHIWEALSGRHLFTYEGHAALILALGWSPDSQHVASGSYDTTVQVWHAHSGRKIATYRNNGQIQSLDWSPDGTRIVSCGGQGTASIWNANTGENIFTYTGHETASSVPSYQYIRPGLSTQYPRDNTYPMEVSAVAWSPDGQWIASGGTGNALHVWHAE